MIPAAQSTHLGGNPRRRTIISRDGSVVDVSGDMWMISADVRLYWKRWSGLPEAIQDSLRSHAIRLIETASPIYCKGQIYHLASLSNAQVAAGIRHELSTLGFLSLRTFNKFSSVVRETVSGPIVCNYQDAYRRWYLHSLDADLPGFDEDVAIALENMIIGGNPKGEAVMGHDPDSGPLRASEISDLIDGLNAATLERALPPEKLAIAWLSLSFGTNPRNLSQLNEEDLIITKLENGSHIFELRIPRIKKRTVTARAQFRTRQLAPYIGELLSSIVEGNRKKSEQDHSSEQARPLFRSLRPRSRLMGTAFERDVNRGTTRAVSAALSEVVLALNLITSGGEPLKVTPRRLRYSFATRLVLEGCSPAELAEALDHSSTDHVMVYFNARLDAVEALNAALAVALMPFAQKCDPVIRTEAEAIRGDEPQSSRVYRTDALARLRRPVGTCGSFSWCSLFAPVACYTCKLFQPWLDGPHQQMMDDLLGERDRRLAAGADTKWTAIHDRTILAIARVIATCDAMLQEEAA